MEKRKGERERDRGGGRMMLSNKRSKRKVKLTKNVKNHMLKKIKGYTTK